MPLDFSDVVVLGIKTIQTDRNVQVVAGHLVVNEQRLGSSRSDDGELKLDRSSTTPAGFAIAAEKIQLERSVVVGGNAFFNTLSNQGTINGSQSTPISTFPIFSPLPQFMAAPAGTQNVNVAKNQTLALAPGNYKDITLQQGAILNLTAGIYNLRSISMDHDAKIRFQNLSPDSARLQVRLTQKLASNHDCFVGPDDNDPTKAAKAIFYVAYTPPSNAWNSSVAELGPNCTVMANFYVPNGTLEMDDNVKATGSFIAKYVEIGKSVRLDLESGWNSPPVITESDPAAVTMSEDGSPTAFSLTLHATDTDPGEVLTWSISAPASHGSASVPAGTTVSGGAKSINYSPNANYNGADSFVVQVTDSHGATDTITVNVTITPVNDAPTATAQSVTTNEDTAKTITLAGADVDGNALSFKITALPAHGQLFDGTGTGGHLIVGGDLPYTVTDGTHKVTYNPAADYNGADSFQFKVNDGTVDSAAAATVSITVTAVNDAPVLAAIEGGTLAYTENGAPITITSSLTVADSDSANLASATVQITTACANPEDVLSFTTQNGISGVYTAASCLMTLSGSSSVANYQTALRSVQYSNTSDNPSTVTRTASFQVNDGAGANNLSNIVTRNISITATNDGPVATAQSVNTDEDTPKTITLAGTDSENDPLSFKITALPAHGNLRDGVHTIVIGDLPYTVTDVSHQVTYAPAVDYNGPDSFQFKVNDGTSDSAAATVSITVDPVNDAPLLIATAGPLAYTENQAATAIDSGLSVTDVDSANLVGATVQITGNCNNGEDVLSFADIAPILGSYTASTCLMTLSGADTVANYQAALRTVKYNNTSDSPNTATRTVTFTANDGAAANNLGSVTRNISLTGANDAPVLKTAGAPALDTINEDQTTNAGTSITSLITSGGAGYITDADAGALQGIAVTAADTANGSWEFTTDNGSNWNPLGAVANNNARLLAAVVTTKIRFVPAADFNGLVDPAITFRAWDQTSGADGALADTTTNGGTTAFSTATDTASITVNGLEDAPVLANIESSTLSYTVNAAPTPVTSTLTVSDVDGGNLASATVQITSNCNNPDDVLSFSTQNGISGVYTAASCLMTLTGSSSIANYQTALRDVKYSNTNSSTDTSAVRSVTFTVNDGVVDSNTQTRNLTVALNSAPVITDTKPAAVTMSEDGSPTPFSLTLHATDADGDTLTWSISSPASHGTASVPAGTTTSGNPKTIDYSPNANYNGSDSFTVQVDDGHSGTDTIIVNVTINAVNDAPVLTAGGTLNYTENDPATVIDNTITVNDVDSANLTSATAQITTACNNPQDVLAFTTQNGISGVYTAATCLMTLTGSSTLANYQTALRSITYANSSDNPNTTARTVTWIGNDGTASSTPVTSTINITAVNDAPVLTAGGTLNYTENQAATAIDTTITVSDVDSTNFTGATAQITGNYQNSEDVLSYVTALGISGSFNATNGTLTLTGTTTVANYQTALRNVKYNNTSENPTTTARTVTWQVNDGGGVNNLSNTATSTINVTAVNDPPVAQDKSGIHVQANMKRTGIDASLLTGVTDADQGVNGCSVSFSVASITAGTHGTVSGVNLGAGTFDFDPEPGFTGNATVTYTVSDTGCPGSATSAPATINITVDGPVIWFVNNAVAGPGDGRLSNPFKTLASADAVDAANHNIFVFTGTYATGIALNTGEALIGQGVSTASSASFTSFDAVFGITPPAGTIARPSIAGTRPTLPNTVTLNTNSAVRGLNISSTTNTGMDDPAGAITGVAVSEVSVTTTTGTAVNLSSLGGTLSFTSISAGGVSGPTTGISLSNTTGSFTVTGSSSGNCGGVVVDKNTAPTAPDTADCTGGTIQNAATGIRLDTAQSVSLTRMHITGTSAHNFGIYGTSVNGFTMAHSVIDGTIGTNTALQDAPLVFGKSNPSGLDGLSGANSISDSTIRGGIEHNMEFYNQSGSFTLSITRTVVRNNSVAGGSDGIQMEMQGAASATLSVDNCFFDENKSQAIQVAANDSSVANVTIKNSKWTKTTQGNEGVVLSNGNNGRLIANIDNNIATNFDGTAIFVGQTPGNAHALAGGAVGLQATIQNNNVTSPATATNHSIIAFLTSTVGETSLARIRIHQNTVTQNSLSGTARGILVDTPDTSTSPSFQATVTDNTADGTDPVNGVGVLVVQARKSATACMNISGNDASVATGGVNALRARQADSATANLFGSGVSSAAVLAANNPASTTEVLGTIGLTGTTCTLPDSPAVP